MSLSSPRSEITEGSRMPSRVMFVWMSQVSDFITGLVSSGVTADRPTKALYVGRTYFDTTLGYAIWYDGTNWVNSAGTTV